jgi:UDP-N-acetylglucosamine--N-acetylmuramyl-(pentapeptide) pyrophosphoryl-undecaprenol N-acetylglucosamine transferase
MKKIIIILGVTGGHIFPGISIANNLKKINKEIDILFINSSNSKIVIPKLRIDYELVEIDSLGFKGKSPLSKIKSILLLIKSIFQSNKIINQFRADAIIGTGGFVSLPVCLCGYLRGIKTFIIEGNSVPGLANKIISIFCENIFINFEESQKYLPKKKCIQTGYPIRDFNLINHNNKKNDLLILGGSQGSESLNTKILFTIQNLLEKISGNSTKNNERFSIVHQTGSKDKERVDNFYKNLKDKYAFLEIETFEFINNLEDFYSNSRVLVSRAGASTISESLRFNVLSIFIPIKDSTNNHQYLNAVELFNKKLAEIHLESEKNTILCNKIINFLYNGEISSVYVKSKKKIIDNSQTAAEKICKKILETA